MLAKLLAILHTSGMQFEEALQQLLVIEKITKEHVAIASGKSVDSVNRWLDGSHEPRIGDVLRIRRAYPSFGALLDKVAA